MRRTLSQPIWPGLDFRPLMKLKMSTFSHHTRKLQALTFSCLFSGRSFILFSFPNVHSAACWARGAPWSSPAWRSSRGKFAAVCSLLQQLSNSLCMTSDWITRGFASATCKRTTCWIDLFSWLLKKKKNTEKCAGFEFNWELSHTQTLQSQVHIVIQIKERLCCFTAVQTTL